MEPLIVTSGLSMGVRAARPAYRLDRRAARARGVALVGLFGLQMPMSVVPGDDTRSGRATLSVSPQSTATEIARRFIA